MGITTRTGEEFDILQDVADSCRGMMEQKKLGKEEFAGIGIGVPGPVRYGRLCGRLRQSGMG